MDHLLLPRTSVHPEQVEYVCSNDDPYDGGDFATYPIRAGWPELLTSHTGLPFCDTCRHTIIDDDRMRKQEQILMAWIFFGLLHKMLSPFALYKATDYIEGHDTKRRLHTKGLRDRLIQWQATMCDYDSREELIADARNCYAISADVLFALDRPAYKTFNRMIKASLLALCSTVEGMIISWLGGTRRIYPCLYVGLDEISRKSMLGNGWCPSEISLVEAASTFSIGWFAQHIINTNRKESHNDCDWASCRRTIMDLDHYQPHHDQEDCQCGSLGPSATDIIDCLRAGDIPVLEVTGEQLSDVALSVRRLSSLDDDTSYVAFSHVWTDGLGNPREMSLPRCQILRLNRLVQGLRSHAFFRSGIANPAEITRKRRLFLWFDTLCCPIELHAKAMALARMRDVYTKAEIVLVLDRGLQAYSYEDVGVLEAGWRVLRSRWMKRLWTYQEAGLARGLLIQFADKPVYVIEIIVRILQMHKEEPYQDRLYDEVASSLISLLQWTRMTPRNAWIIEAVKGLAHRRVTVPSDEPLCLSTVLGLNNTQIARARPEERMQLIWRMICEHQYGVTQSVIFTDLGRMTTPGFRWAPQSFLQPSGRVQTFFSHPFEPTRYKCIDYIDRAGGGKKAILLDRGLRVQCPGWRILPPPPPKGISKEICATPWRSVLPAKFPDGSCYHITKSMHDGIPGPQHNMLETVANDSKEWFVILEETATREWDQWGSSQRALLVSKELHECGLSYYRSHMCVSVDRIQPRFETARQVEYIYGDAIRRSWLMRSIALATKAETGVNVILSWLPDALSNTIVAWLDPLVDACAFELARHLSEMMHTRLGDALKQPAASRLWQAAGCEKEALRGDDVVDAVMGRYVNVEEVFDSSTEWVVD